MSYRAAQPAENAPTNFVGSNHEGGATIEKANFDTLEFWLGSEAQGRW